MEPQTTEDLARSREADVPTLTLSFEETVGQVGQEISLPLKITSSTPIKEPFQIILRFPPSKLEYAKLGIGQGPRKAGWKLESELKRAPIAFDMHFLEILVKPGEGDFLPEGGALALAYFKILEADADHAIELSPSIKPLGDAPLRREKGTRPDDRPPGRHLCLLLLHALKQESYRSSTFDPSFTSSSPQFSQPIYCGCGYGRVSTASQRSYVRNPG